MKPFKTQAPKCDLNHHRISIFAGFNNHLHSSSYSILPKRLLYCKCSLRYNRGKREKRWGWLQVTAQTWKWYYERGSEERGCRRAWSDGIYLDKIKDVDREEKMLLLTLVMLTMIQVSHDLGIWKRRNNAITGSKIAFSLNHINPHNLPVPFYTALILHTPAKRKE